MEGLLSFGIKFVFILFCINALFLAAQGMGLYTGPVGTTLKQTEIHETLSDLNTALSQSGQEPEVSSKEQTQEGSIKEKQTLDVGSLIWNGVFGYATLIKQIIPEAASAMADAIAYPIMFLQSVIMMWWGIETWYKIKPF